MFAVASSGWGEGIDPNFLFHCVLGEVKIGIVPELLFHCLLGEVKSINPEFFVSSLYISVTIKASLLKFNMFNIHKKQYF